MARGLPIGGLIGRAPGVAWCGLAALLALGALIAWAVPPQHIDWQPSLVSTQPWRAWTAAFVHLSPGHLAANLLGTALVALLGWRSAAPTRLALAWFIAWPLTHLALALQPELAHYGGLSGVLHAGVAAVALQLIGHGTPRERWLGGAMLAGLALKLVSETPWLGAVQHTSGWDIGIAPFAHVTGAFAGALCAGLVGLSRACLRQASRSA